MAGLTQRKISFTDEQWQGLQLLSRDRGLSVSATVRELVDVTLKLYIRKDTTKP